MNEYIFFKTLSFLQQFDLIIYKFLKIYKISKYIHFDSFDGLDMKRNFFNVRLNNFII